MRFPIRCRGAQLAAACLTAYALAANAADAVHATAAPYGWDSVAIGGGGFVTAVIPSRTSSLAGIDTFTV